MLLDLARLRMPCGCGEVMIASNPVLYRAILRTEVLGLLVLPRTAPQLSFGTGWLIV